MKWNEKWDGTLKVKQLIGNRLWLGGEKKIEEAYRRWTTAAGNPVEGGKGGGHFPVNSSFVFIIFLSVTFCCCR